MKIKSILFVAIIFLCCSCSVQKKYTSLEKEMSWLEGKWIGVGYQADAMTAQTWSIELKVDVKNKKCSINYPSLECSGKWVLKNGNSNAATFVEHITEGKDKCFDQGELIITKVDENHLSYSFFYPKNHQLGAFSTLVKSEYAKKLNSKRL